MLNFYFSEVNEICHKTRNGYKNKTPKFYYVHFYSVWEMTPVKTLMRFPNKNTSNVDQNPIKTCTDKYKQLHSKFQHHGVFTNGIINTGYISSESATIFKSLSINIYAAAGTISQGQVLLHC